MEMSERDTNAPMKCLTEECMREHLKFYIDGQWVEPAGQARTHDVINPATEEPIGRIALGSKADVDKAVVAARRAFDSFSRTSVK